MFSISRQISPEHLIYRLRFDQSFPITLRIEIQGFDGKFSFLIRPNVELNNFLTFNYLSAEKWKKIDNVSFASNKLFFIQETDHLRMR